MSNKILQDIVALLRIALKFSKAKDESHLFNQETDWKAIYTLSQQQGILALTFTGAMQLPFEKQPPRKLKINWGVNVELIKDRNKYHQAIVCELGRLFEEQGIRMLLLKGRNVASMYPDPLLREECDIDIYLLNDNEKGSQIIKDIGIHPCHTSEKHHTFLYKGVQVEYHYNFLNSHKYNSDRILKSYLSDILTQECVQKKDYYYTPSPNFNGVFLFRHSVTHLNAKNINLRFLCDWACFLSKYGDQLEYEKIKQILSKVSLSNLLETFIFLCIHLFGLQLGEVFSQIKNTGLEQTIITTILKKEETCIQKGIFSQIKRRYNSFIETQKLHKLLYDQYNWENIRFILLSKLLKANRF